MAMWPLELTPFVKDMGANAGLMCLLVFGLSLLERPAFGPRQMAEGDARAQWRQDLWGGFLFGVAAIGAMTLPLRPIADVIIDTRCVVLALAAVLLRWPAAVLAMVMALAYRAVLGGPYVGQGVGVILAATALGWLWRHTVDAGATQGAFVVGWRATSFAMLGVCLAFLPPGAGLTLPDVLRDEVFWSILPVTLVAFPIMTAVFGTLVEALRWLRDREAMLRALVEKNALAATVFEHSRESIVILDSELRIIDANPATLEVTGFARDELVGEHIDVLKSGRQDGSFATMLLERVRHDGYWEGELWRRRKNGEIFPAHLSVVAIFHPDHTIQQLVCVGSDLSQVRRHEEELQRAASYDPLTGLPNRKLFMQRLQREMQLATRSGTMVAVCYMDLDDFKHFNDGFGHQMGDALLVNLTARLKDVWGEAGALGRLGGDEFVALLTGYGDRDALLHHLHEALHRIQAPLAVEGQTENLRVSMGVALYPEDRSDADTLLRHADQAMYAAKEAGKNRIEVFDVAYDVEQQTRRETVARIERAIDEGEMALYYQPKVRISDGSLLGVEALVRWRHPERGVLAPAAFLAEISGTPVSEQLDHWVLRTAMQQAAVWVREGLRLSISINMTVSTLVAPSFLAQVKAMLADHPDVPRHTLEVELLETETLNDLSLVGDVIEGLNELGVNCAIDDFGTGYSSLTYLQRLPAQVIKIDQSFVRDMLVSRQDSALVKGIIGLATAFGREVVAEGVESQEQALELARMGCDILQGYGIARPMPADALLPWAQNWRMPYTWRESATRGVSRA